MEIAGRNDPCPCGSGKKYKKCCLSKDTDPAARATAPTQGGERATSTHVQRSGLNIHPYALARMATELSPATRAQLSKKEIAALHAKWSPDKLARLPTEEIVSRLHGLGISASKEAFLALAEGRTDAWLIGNQWVKGMKTEPAGDDEDFICLSACELWKRYCPDVPSLEMLDDWVAEGYVFTEAHQDDKAATIWLRVWDVVRQRFHRDMTTFEAADPVFQCTQFLSNWLQDFVLSAQNAALDDPAYAQLGVRVVREVLDQFTGEEADTLVHYRCDLGSLLFRAGQTGDGEALLSAVIREWPRLPHGYVRLADELSMPKSPATDLERAQRILEEAWRLPVKDAQAWGIKARIADLKSRQASHSEHKESRA